MGNSIYGIAISGLNAAQVALNTASHNIVNANTPGYNRQKIDQAATAPQPSGGGFVGRGVEITGISRIYDAFIGRQVQIAKAQDGYLTGQLSHLSDLDNLMADPSAGFSPSLQDFFTGVQTVAKSPKDVSARQSLIGLAQSMITKMHTVNERMQVLRDDVNTEITSSVANINSITNQIAALNDQIILVSGVNGQNPPNDLLDQRDQLVKDLNGYVKATVVKQSDGSYNVFIGNGQNLVVGSQAFTLGSIASVDDPSRLQVAYQQFGATVVIPDNLITGGSLGGVLEFRAKALDETQNALGRIAIALGQTVNNQHRSGQDLNGQYGGNFFQFPVEQINAQYNLGANGRTMTAELASALPYIESDYNVAFDGTNYTITRMTDGQTSTVAPASVLAAGGQLAFGVRFHLDGNLAAGENFGVSFRPAASHVLASSKNTGDADLQVSISSVGALTSSDYELTVDKIDDPSTVGVQEDTYTLLRKSDGMITRINGTQWATPPVVVDGMEFRLNGGTFKAGDRFTIQPTRDFAENMSVMITDTAKIAAAAPIRTSADAVRIVTSGVLTNTGTGAINTITNSLNANGGTTAKKIEIVFTGPATYDIRDAGTGVVLAGNQPYTTGGNITYNGWTVQISGSPNTGDRFVIEPRRNTGSATISAGTVNSAPVNINLKNPVAVQFLSSASYQLVDPTNGNVLQAAQPYTSGSNISFNDWTVSVSGVPATGDTFLIEANTGGTADARNILAIGQLQTMNTMVGGTSSFQGSYSKMVADVGVRTNQVKINQKAQASLLQQAETKQQQLSGVNLDEEAANLLNFQQAYQAASRTIQIAQKAFEEVLNIGR
ncbi:flagellar hook-associated protein FlgK [Chitinimonas sp. BJB300]|uniref:flagellar hook-associated protein FlgK n=1 Tax=Chitinimonas sp. BJB300 TaxID=1559339 RepID=UPI000C11BC4D|nr:flagellar hook-associated protein FlgK [Chitinimonas sp. BJB300]PHV11242.1 flagellar hook-associated protein FlgK [Chitinimonas sp. BJB300]TSJ88612.1 flagellar hook-associated protein FlgK [Chitinimonas sp. BJB300]